MLGRLAPVDRSLTRRAPSDRRSPGESWLGLSIAEPRSWGHSLGASEPGGSRLSGKGGRSLRAQEGGRRVGGPDERSPDRMLGGVIWGVRQPPHCRWRTTSRLTRQPVDGQSAVIEASAQEATERVAELGTSYVTPRIEEFARRERPGDIGSGKRSDHRGDRR